MKSILTRRLPGILAAAGAAFTLTIGLAAQELPAHLDGSALVEEEVQLEGTGYPVPATITVPRGADAFPVAVVLTGSGPNDRDGSLGPNKVYRDLAWGLANKGVASIRFDKRTLHYGVGDAADDPAGFPYMEWEYADDAEAAIELARALPGATSIVLVGHSLGATVAARIAVEQDVDALVMIAGSARRFGQISIDQNRYLVERMEQTPELDGQLAALVQFFEAVLRHEIPAETPVQPGLPVAYYYAVDEYMPQEYLARLDAPVLITQGSDDFQALVDADYRAFEAELSSRPNVTFRLFGGLNHLMMRSTNPDAGAADYAIPGFMDAAFIGYLAEWITASR